VIRVFKAAGCFSITSEDKSVAQKIFFDNNLPSQDKFWSALTKPHNEVKSC